jgi:hypothetical protein
MYEYESDVRPETGEHSGPKFDVSRPLLEMYRPPAEGWVLHQLSDLELGLEDGVPTHHTSEVVENTTVVQHCFK